MINDYFVRPDALDVELEQISINFLKKKDVKSTENFAQITQYFG